MKKLLIIALLFVGCGRYEDKGKTGIALCGRVDARFDNWFGKTTYNIDGKWYTEEEWAKSKLYKTIARKIDNCDSYQTLQDELDCRTRVNETYCP